MVVAFGGTSFLLDVLARNPSAFRSVVGFFVSLGLGVLGTFIALIVIGLVLFGVVGWLMLQWLRRGYQSKWVNDQSLRARLTW